MSEDIILDRTPKDSYKDGTNNNKYRGSEYRGVSRNGN